MSKPRPLHVLTIVSVVALSSSAFASGPYVITPAGVGCFDQSVPPPAQLPAQYGSPAGTCFILLNSSATIPTASSGCASGDQVRFSLSDPGGPELYKTALAAFLSGRHLTVITSGCYINGTLPWVQYLYISP